MATVHALRNEIRVAVGRYERVESTQFTKESLAAIHEALVGSVDANDRPSKSAVRARILDAVDADEDAESVDRAFRKAELEAIATALRDE